MKKFYWVAFLIGIVTASACCTFAQEKPVADSSDADAKYTQTIEKRTADILAALYLKDPAKTAQVHDAIMAQYRALRDWQATNEGKLKAASKDKNGKAQVAEIMASRKTLHNTFIAKLSAVLTPEQVDIVKDKLTYNKLKVTYDAYCQIVPNLTDAEKAKMFDLLKEAREEAMDGTSSDEKSAIFKKYKGKINYYLSGRGHDVAKAYKDWGAKTHGQAAAPVEPPVGH